MYYFFLTNGINVILSINRVMWKRIGCRSIMKWCHWCNLPLMANTFLLCMILFKKLMKFFMLVMPIPLWKKKGVFFKNIREKNFETLSNNAITLTCFTAIASSMGQFFIVDTSSTTFKFMIKGLNSTSFLYWKMAWIRRKISLSRILRILRKISSFLY